MGEIKQPTTVEGRATQGKYIPTNYDVIFRGIYKQMRVGRKDIMSKKRDRKLVEARQMFCLLAREHTGESSVEIGNAINRDHATVLYSIATMRNLISFTKRLAIARNYIELDIVPKLKTVGKVKVCEHCKQPIYEERLS